MKGFTNPYLPPQSDCSTIPKVPLQVSYLVGFLGLSLGTLFYAVLCLFLFIGLINEASGLPSIRECFYIIMAFLVHGFTLTFLIILRKRIYHLSTLNKWITALVCWIFIGLYLLFMMLSLGV